MFEPGDRRRIDAGARRLGSQHVRRVATCRCRWSSSPHWGFAR